MNEIVNKFLLAGDKFIPEMHLTLNFYVSTHTYAVSEKKPFSTKTPLILLMSAFVSKNYFLSKIVPLLKAIV